MTENSARFAELLKRAVNRIHANEGMSKTIVRDELGYAAGREGRTAIDYWCRDSGHIPAEQASVEGLAREIARRGGLNAAEMAAFLAAACHPSTKALCNELYPSQPRNRQVESPTDEKQDDSIIIEHVAATSPVILSFPVPTPADPINVTEVPAPLLSNTGAPTSTQPTRRLRYYRWGFLVLGLLIMGLVAGFVWFRSSSEGETLDPGQIQLAPMDESPVTITTEGRVLRSGDRVPVNTPITVTFRVMNNSVGPVTLRSLVIGVRGPGVTCSSEQETRWNALDVPFPPARNLLLQPGEEYTYEGTRAFYRPGTYFLEPAEQDVNGNWGGIPAFTCFDMMVVEEVR